MRVIPVILCGGSGKRLWPLSRESYPKQFLPLTSKNTLFQETLTRFNELKNINFSKPIIISNDEHRFIIAEQIKQIGIEQEAIILEPIGRNTAPAIAAVTEYLFQNGSEEALLLILPSDHLIHDIESFGAAIENAINTSDKFDFTLFGIVPNGPNTNYGYIKKGQNSDESNYHIVEKFVEKPNQEDADKFYKSGNYLWNSGIFMMKKSVWIENISRYEPKLFTGCHLAMENGTKDGLFYRPEAKHVQDIEQISIDNAVMEKIFPDKEIGVVFRLDVGWSDLGDWKSLASIFDSNLENNVLKGDVRTLETNNSFIMSESRLVVSVGVDDLIIVETADAVLVTNRDHVQNVREIVQNLKEEGRVEFETHRKVDRPWGSYEILDTGEGYQVKRLIINPSSSLSLQLHFKRSEHWVVVRGVAKITKDEESFELNKNESTFVPQGVTHRIENMTDSPVEMIEIQVGVYLGEDDIVRIQDKYNR